MLESMYDEKLKEIEMLQLHPTFLPYVGSLYEEYKILQIGESHYIGQTRENETYGIKYFEKWWSEPCDELAKEYGGWFDTRHVVIDNFLDEQNVSYRIFTNFIESFSKIVLEDNFAYMTKERIPLYRYAAFMNFFQMPSLYDATSFYESLDKSAKLAGDKSLAGNMWDCAVKHSVATVDAVIEIIKPRAIVFTSISAGNAYKENNGKYREDERMIFTSHPAYPFTWNKKLKSLGGQTGKEVFEQGLKRIYNK
jgi:hypothetical protein